MFAEGTFDPSSNGFLTEIRSTGTSFSFGPVKTPHPDFLLNAENLSLSRKGRGSSEFAMANSVGAGGTGDPRKIRFEPGCPSCLPAEIGFTFGTGNYCS